MLSDFILNSLLQLILLFIFNFIILVLHELIYFLFYVLNFIFFLFYLLDKFTNLLHASSLVSLLYLIHKFFLLLFVNIIPDSILFSKLFFNILGFQSRFFN